MIFKLHNDNKKTIKKMTIIMINPYYYWCIVPKCLCTWFKGDKKSRILVIYSALLFAYFPCPKMT